MGWRCERGVEGVGGGLGCVLPSSFLLGDCFIFYLLTFWSLGKCRCFEYIEEMIHKQEPLINVLRLLVLFSITNSGLPKKNFDYLRRVNSGNSCFIYT